MWLYLFFRGSLAAIQPARPKPSSAGVHLVGPLAPCPLRPDSETVLDLPKPSSPTPPTTTPRPSVHGAAASPESFAHPPKTPQIPPRLLSAPNFSLGPGKVRDIYRQSLKQLPECLQSEKAGKTPHFNGSSWLITFPFYFYSITSKSLDYRDYLLKLLKVHYHSKINKERKKELNTLFSMGAFNWSKMAVRIFTLLQNLSISNECCSFERSINQRILKKYIYIK